MFFLKPISLRVQLGFIALGYAAVLVVGASLFYERHLQELDHPADVMASGGMYAFGDTLLAIFIACLFMIPTVFLVWLLARCEALYTAYSQFRLGLSLSAPVCLSVFLFGENDVAQSLGFLCFFRLLGSPFIPVGIGVSRLAVRSDRAKRLASYALVIEGVTLSIAVALFIRG